MSRLAPGRALLLALGLGLAARLAVFGLGLSDSRRFLTLDAGQYLQLARDPVAGYLDPRSELMPIGLLRTPGYPLFAAPWLALGGEAAVIAAQILLSAVSIGLVFVLARRLFDGAAAGCAAVLLALDPASVVYTCLLQPETLFTLLLLASALAWRAALDGAPAAAACAGLLLGLATLTRPIALFLPFALLVTPWLRPEFARARRPALVAALLLPFLLLAGGWIARNARVAGAPVLSTIEGTNLLYYRAAGALARERGVSIDETRAELEREMSRRVPAGASAAERSRLESARGAEILAAHPRGALIETLLGAGRLVAGTGITALSGLGPPPGARRSLAAAFALLLASLYFGAATGAWQAARGGAVAALVFLATFLAYLLLISSGPEAVTRFRVPMAPFLAALAGLGWSRMLAR